MAREFIVRQYLILSTGDHVVHIAEQGTAVPRYVWKAYNAPEVDPGDVARTMEQAARAALRRDAA